MKASIVICTYRRPELTIGLLRELDRQRYKDFEVIVICQGDRSDLEKIKASVNISYSLRYYYEEIPNLPRARNIGINESSQEIVIFLDDDVKPHNNLIETHLANYTDLGIGIVGGRVLEYKSRENTPDSKIGMIRRFDGFTYSGFNKNLRCDVMQVRGVNMSVRRSVALEVGGFDERFQGTAEYEDMDFCLRVLKKGYKIIFDPKAVIEHFSFSTGGCRGNNREDSIYWLYRNHSLAFLKNLNKFFYPILILEYFVRIILRSMFWRNVAVIASGFKGIRDGWRAYFSNAR